MTHNQVSFPAKQMADLYQRLAKIGLSKKYLKDHILPDWWTDEVDQTPGVVTQGAIYLARRLNLDCASLINEAQPRFNFSSTPKFKTNDGTNLTQLAVANAIASRIAEMVAAATCRPYQDITTLTIAEIRQQILCNHSTVDLASVLQFCESQGIPVIHFAQLPAIIQRFQGMVAIFQGRPVILISRKDRSPAWLLFIIVHELGHILREHLKTDGLLIDQEIQLESDDAEENEANQVAVELLLGRPGISYDLWSRYITDELLAAQARSFAQETQNDPGVIALNIAWNRAQRAKTDKEKRIAWAVGKKALQILEADINPAETINQQLVNQINTEVLGEENQDYLAAMLGLPMNVCGDSFRAGH